MARKRMISPDIWEDEKFSKLDFVGRLLFIGLITQANDYGKLRGNPTLLKSKIFPYDDKKINIEEQLQQLAELGLIIVYEVNGEKFIKIKNWFKHQVLTYKGKDDIPEPPEQILNQSLTNPEQTLNKSVKELNQSLILSKDKLSKDNINNKEREKENIINNIKEKEKEIEDILSTKSDKFKEIFNQYLEMRKKIKKPATQYAIKLALLKLNKLAPDDEDKQIKILEQSIINSWQGLFELKEEGGYNYAKSPTNLGNIDREYLEQKYAKYK